ncbi:MAG: hypothetical protein LBB61_10310 [Treponema sp.]|nr:hypothetical protein [Treponema sp.]
MEPKVISIPDGKSGKSPLTLLCRRLKRLIARHDSSAFVRPSAVTPFHPIPGNAVFIRDNCAF